MAALGNIGFSISDRLEIAEGASILSFGVAGVSPMFAVPQRRNNGGVAARGLLDFSDYSSARSYLGEYCRRQESRTRQVYGETQLNGTPASLRVLVTSNGAVLDSIKSSPELVISDLNENMPYEITVFGAGSQRTETWGVSSVDAGGVMELSGTLLACTASVAYSSGLTVTGGFGDVVWDLWGSLPTGLGFNPTTGLITGTTTEVGTYRFDIGVTREGVRRWKNVTLVVT